MKRILLFIALMNIIGITQAQTTLRMVPDSTFAITLQQDTLSLDSLRAQYDFVVFEFFFAESELCKETSTYVNQAFKDVGYNENQVFFLSINVGNDSIECQHYQDTLGLEMPMASGIQGNGSVVADSFNIQSYPTIILIGANAIGEEIISIDTIGEGEDMIIDTTYGEYTYNIYEQDIWPIDSSEDILEALNKHGITGVNEDIAQKENIFQVYPNPSNGFFYLKSDKLESPQGFEYQIIDISGKIIIEDKTINAFESPIHIEGLKTGMYFIRVRANNSYYTQKLLVE
ncbi:MAG: hypothetical protein B7C24_11200 [Bacteroidetes bacterium 4572_77]|nr:MAG: hypothetical protein B7C24_11200 [Bacteroidetes bacterium 4572_77]